MVRDSIPTEKKIDDVHGSFLPWLNTNEKLQQLKKEG
jgi:hypothetical protein